MAFNIIEVSVCGLRKYSFTGNKGEEVEMVSCAFQYTDNRYIGQAVGSVNVSGKRAVADAIGVGSRLKVVFYDKKWNFVEAV